MRTKVSLPGIWLLLSFLLAYPAGAQVLNPENQLLNDSLPLIQMASVANDAPFIVPKVNSPDVANIMKYIDQPVDLCYGQVKVDIPLYELVAGDIVLPIVLSYNCSGMKVEGGNGRVAYGWSLIAEPTLSRKINDKADEYGYYSGIPSTARTDFALYSIGIVDYGYQQEEYPDAFYYRLLDKSGKFYFDHGNLGVTSWGNTPSIVTNPYEPLKIEYHRNFTRFHITDENGYVYNFRDRHTTLEATVGPLITDWNPSSIIAPNKQDSIYFSYDNWRREYYYNITDFVAIECWDMQGLTDVSSFAPGDRTISFPFMYTFLNGQPQDISNLSLTLESSNLYRAAPRDHGSPSSAISFPRYSSSGSMIIYPLKTIESVNTKIELLTHDGYRISQIKVSDKLSGRILRTIVLNTNKYSTSGSGGETDRYYLASVSIKDGASKEVEFYKFDYYNTFSPGRHDKNVDHWGYFNGITLGRNDLAVPRQQVNTSTAQPGTSNRYNFVIEIGQANKEPDLIRTRTGVLKSIKYPTGRVSDFSYELNKYYDVRERDTITVGGLRVHKITEHDPVSGKTLTRSFRYDENEYGGGRLRHPITADNYYYSIKNCYTPNPAGNSFYPSTVHIYTGTAIPQLNYPSGSPVFYSHVTEYLNNGDMGKITYVYSLPSNTVNQQYATTLTWDSDQDWTAGKLTEKIEYEASETGTNRTYTPKRKESYSYNELNKGTIMYGQFYKNLYIRMYSQASLQQVKNLYAQYSGIKHNRVNMYTGAMRLGSKKIENYFEGSTALTTTERYEYANLNTLLPTKITTVNSNDAETVVSMKYIEDVTYPTGSVENTARTSLIAANKIATLVARETVTGTANWGENIKYKVDATSGLPLPYVYTDGPLNNQQTKVEVLKYDRYGNPMHVRESGTTDVVYVWGYNGRFLIAEIRNCTYTQLVAITGDIYTRLASANTPAAADMQKINDLRSADNGLLVSTYTYDPAYGLTSAQDPSGRTTTYVYDSFGRLATVKDPDGKKVTDYEYNYAN